MSSRHHPPHHPDPDPHRRDPELAVQPRLGLRPERRYRPYPDHRPDLGAAGSDLGRRTSWVVKTSVVKRKLRPTPSRPTISRTHDLPGPYTRRAPGNRFRKRGSFPGVRRTCARVRPSSDTRRSRISVLANSQASPSPSSGGDVHLVARTTEREMFLDGDEEVPYPFARQRRDQDRAAAAGQAVRGGGEALAIGSIEQIRLVPDLDEMRLVARVDAELAQDRRHVARLRLRLVMRRCRGRAGSHRPRSPPPASRGRPRRASSAGRR